MGGNKYLIKEGKDFLNKEGDNTLYVFFYNADPNYEIGGYMPLTTILEYVEQRIVLQLMSPYLLTLLLVLSRYVCKFSFLALLYLQLLNLRKS